MPDHATIEIYRDGRWQPAATLAPDQPAQGYRGRAAFEYLTEYAVERAGPGIRPEPSNSMPASL